MTPPLVPHPEAPLVATEQFTIEREENGHALTIRGDTYLWPDARTGVVFCHGFKGFGRWGFYPYLAPSVAAAGLNVVTFDFSGSGVGEDRERYTEPDAFASNTYARELADIEAVVRHARERGWIGDTYGVFGHSRGGGDAILHAAKHAGVGALVTWAAIAHVLRWMAAAAEEWRRRGYTEVTNTRTGEVLRLNTTLLDECERFADTDLSVERAAEKVRARWLIVHGDADPGVSVDDAHKLYTAALPFNDKVQLDIVEGGDHVFGATHPLNEIHPHLRRVVARTVDFFREHLR